MTWNKEETDIILFLGKRAEEGSDWVTSAEAAQACALTPSTCEKIFWRLHQANLAELTYGGDQSLPNDHLISESRKLSEERERAAHPDWVARWTTNLRHNKVAAVLVMIYLAIFPLVGLVGGILGIVIFFRSP
ncbi:MAG: hypothetical protein WBD75_00240 [Phycisphaerae bacterium]